MQTRFVTSKDGTRIAYDTTGGGPVIVLLHGGGMHRGYWHNVGYVGKLKDRFQVVSVDLRGHGESDKPASSGAYDIEALCQDVLTVVDACRAARFTIWGCSFGGNVGRYLAAATPRVHKLLMLSAYFGAGAWGTFRDLAEQFLAHWRPIVLAEREGTLDLKSLSQDDLTMLQATDIVVAWAIMRAMLDWHSVEPQDLMCPTLWLSGTDDHPAVLEAMKKYAPTLSGTKIETLVIDGLTHEEMFLAIDSVFPAMLAFTASSQMS